jgi:hypothetical protein
MPKTIKTQVQTLKNNLALEVSVFFKEENG